MMVIAGGGGCCLLCDNKRDGEEMAAARWSTWYGDVKIHEWVKFEWQEKYRCGNDWQKCSNKRLKVDREIKISICWAPFFIFTCSSSLFFDIWYEALVKTQQPSKRSTLHLSILFFYCGTGSSQYSCQTHQVFPLLFPSPDDCFSSLWACFHTIWINWIVNWSYFGAETLEAGALAANNSLIWILNVIKSLPCLACVGQCVPGNEKKAPRAYCIHCAPAWYNSVINCLSAWMAL